MHDMFKSQLASLKEFKAPGDLDENGRRILSAACASIRLLEREDPADQLQGIKILYRLTIPGTPEYHNCTLFQLQRGGAEETFEGQIGLWVDFLLERPVMQLSAAQQKMVDFSLLYAEDAEPSPLRTLALKTAQLVTAPGGVAREISAPLLRAEGLADQRCRPADVNELVSLPLMSVEVVNTEEKGVITDLADRLPTLYALEPRVAAFSGHVIEVYAPSTETAAIGAAREAQLRAFASETERGHLVSAGYIAMHMLQVDAATGVAYINPLARFLRGLLPRMENEYFVSSAKRVLAGDSGLVGLRQASHPCKLALRNEMRRQSIQQLQELRAAG